MIATMKRTQPRESQGAKEWANLIRHGMTAFEGCVGELDETTVVYASRLGVDLNGEAW